jgi:formate hydrogenlyase transcriptional activator
LRIIHQRLNELFVHKQQLEEENLYLQEERNAKYNFSEIIGAGTEMQKVFHLVSQVATSDATVLLMGETGTGKELIARAIHNSSLRKDKLMVKVNCATLPPNLIESELFGHEKGSFTGATDRRIGKFELANNSTLFLDEIGELPLDLQAKLLRVLQEKEIERIGGRASIKVNVRIIAATNRNLQKEADANRFRSDLFYRLNVFPVILPPLRHRKEDISVLTEHFIARYARMAGKKINGISPKVMESLLSYSWPGNVRELEHLVERSILLTTGTTIKQMHLPTAHQKEPGNGEFTIVPLDEMERTYILKVLKVCKGRISGPYGAAVKLGLPSTTLISKMQKLGIKKEHFHDPL